MLWKIRHERALKLLAMYDEWFASHEISELTVTSQTLARVLMRPTATRHFGAVEIVTLRFGTLLAHGDVTATLFGHYTPAEGEGGWRDHIRWMARASYDYAVGKARLASERPQDRFDSDVAMGDVLYWRRMRFIGRDIARQLYELARDGNEYELTDLAWRSNVVETEDVARLGKCTDPHVYAALAAIRRANALLEARDLSNVS